MFCRKVGRPALANGAIWSLSGCFLFLPTRHGEKDHGRIDDDSIVTGPSVNWHGSTDSCFIRAARGFRFWLSCTCTTQLALPLCRISRRHGKPSTQIVKPLPRGRDSRVRTAVKQSSAYPGKCGLRMVGTGREPRSRPPDCGGASGNGQRALAPRRVVHVQRKCPESRCCWLISC